jgi:hypothetical protein
MVLRDRINRRDPRAKPFASERPRQSELSRRGETRHALHARALSTPQQLPLPKGEAS